MHWFERLYHARVCVPFLGDWLMVTHDFCLSHTGSQQRAHRLRKAWRKERGKKVIISEPLRPDPRASCFGGSLPGMRDGYCPSCSIGRGGFRACTGMVRELGGRVGEKFEFLLNSVTTAGIVTKRHFDNYMGQEVNIASPWWLYVIGGIHRNKSTHWHVSSVFLPGKSLVLRRREKEDELKKKG